jgi:hypothetical protein
VKARTPKGALRAPKGPPAGDETSASVEAASSFGPARTRSETEGPSGPVEAVSSAGLSRSDPHRSGLAVCSWPFGGLPLRPALGPPAAGVK